MEDILLITNEILFLNSKYQLYCYNFFTLKFKGKHNLMYQIADFIFN